MNKKDCRDLIKLIFGILFIWLYIPHLLMLLTLSNYKRQIILSDIYKIKNSTYKIKFNNFCTLIFLLHSNSYYRSLFYRRLGPVRSILVSWLRPGNSSFILPYSTKYGKSLLFFHPFSTVLNAEIIGNNFTCHQCITIGNRNSAKRPVIGDNVFIGAGALVLGNINIGNNVTIGAGSLVINDVPDNAIVAGSPAKVIGYN